MNDEFYIGYRKSAPGKLARYILAVSVVIVLCMIAAAIVIGAAQTPPGDGTYSFGRAESFDGPLRAEPYLHMIIGGETDVDPLQRQAALIVGQGKHGAPEFVRDAAGKRVRLDATRIDRDGVLMLETAGANRFELLGDAEDLPEPDLSSETISITGELVDTKCYLGVMNPGRGKIHRGCAVECLRGGVPPALLVRDSAGNSHIVLLDPLDATAPRIDPEWAARTLVVQGVRLTTGTITVLKYSHASIAR